MASVELRGLTMRFGPHVAVDNVSLRIDHGQLVCLLGPSGCGKTTTLRLIAGFLEPSGGEIKVGDRLVSSVARALPPRIERKSGASTSQQAPQPMQNFTGAFQTPAQGRQQTNA